MTIRFLWQAVLVVALSALLLMAGFEPVRASGACPPSHGPAAAERLDVADGGVELA